jgi:hypothetical protein
MAREHPETLAVVGRTAFRRRQARRWARLAEMRLRAGDAAGARSAMNAARALRPVHLGYRLRAIWLRFRGRP